MLETFNQLPLIIQLSIAVGIALGISTGGAQIILMRYGNLPKRLTDTASQVEQQKQETTTLASSLDEVKASLEAKIDALNQDLLTERAAREAAEQSKNQLRDHFEKTIGLLNDRITHLDGEVLRIQNQLAEKEKEVLLKDETLATKQATIDKLIIERDGLQVQVNDLTTRNQAMLDMATAIGVKLKATDEAKVKEVTDGLD